MRSVTIIVPFIRPEKLKVCLASIHLNAGIPGDQYKVLAVEDIAMIGCPLMVKKLVEASDTDMVMFLGDDTVPQHGFLKEALKAMGTFEDGWGLVGLAGNRDDDLATHWLAHKKLLPLLDGEFFHTGYTHCFCDRELTDRCKEMGRYVYAKGAVVLHDNPAHGRESDKDYERVYSKEVFNKDQLLFWERRRCQMGAFKFGIGVPLTGAMVHSQYHDSWVMMERPDFTYLRPDFPGPIHIVRNALVHQALTVGCSHLVMLDTDQVYPAATLMDLLRHGKTVVGAVVHRRYPPFDPILYRGGIKEYVHVPLEECYSGKLVEVDATGCGCILYNTEVFRKIPHPWFEMTEPDCDVIGEDIGFCHKLRQHGFSIFVDTSIEITHLALMEINRSSHLMYKTLTRAKEKHNGSKKGKEL